MNRLITIVLGVLFSISALAQVQSVTGIVTDASNGEPLTGVSVVVKGTTIGAITDINGNYSINVGSDATLVFSFIGMVSQEVLVGNQTIINVSLEESSELLDEVVVVGYGTQKSRDLTSSIVTIKSDEIAKAPVGQAMQSLQGKVAGVQIVNNGSPGASPVVRVRGLGSYSGSTAPLYVVDGTFYDNIDFLNTSDIENISILKDASAAAIYGVRASNGVVIITTKGGAFNTAATVTYDAYYGVQVPTNVLKMANAEQFVGYINQLNDQSVAAGDGEVADISYIANAMQLWGRSRVNPNVPDVNTDWYKEVMRASAPKQNHSLHVKGGAENVAYALGLSYYNEEGILDMKNSLERMNVTSKLDIKPTKWMKVGVDLNVSSAVRYIGNAGAFKAAYNAVPILPVTDDDNYNNILGSELDSLNTAVNLATATLAGYRSAQNPYLSMDFSENRQDIKKIQTGIYGEIELIPNKLKFRSDYNVSTLFLKGRSFSAPYLVSGDTYRSYSSLSSSRTMGVNQYWDNTLNYSEQFAAHKISLMLGTSFRDEMYNSINGYSLGVPMDEYNWFLNSNLIDATLWDESKNVGESGSRYYGLSYFGRASYSYQGKYLAYFTLRRDGSHRYSEKWGTFPAFGLGWVVSDESFFSVDAIDFFKIRGGWGKLGRDNGATSSGSNTVNTVSLPIADQQVSGIYSTSTYTDLGWEVVVGKNVGITSMLLNNRLSIDADYYIRDTENAIIPVSLLLQAGSILRNVGGIRNSGFELNLGWSDQVSSDFSYTVNANFATLKNEVTSLYGQEYLNSGSAEFRQRSEVGHPLFSFYGYEVEGVYQNETEIAGDSIAIVNGLVPGDLKFKDQDDNNELNEDDKVYLGSYLPNITYGGSVGVNYKGLAFSMSFYGQRGNKIINRKRGEIIWTNDMNQDAELLTNLWNGEGTSDRYPSASGLRRGWNQNFSDFIVEDGSFFRIQNVQLSYNFANDALFNGMPETRVYLTAEKPITLSSYNGFSPEVPDGNDNQYYPIPAIYTVGVNVKF